MTGITADEVSGRAHELISAVCREVERHTEWEPVKSEVEVYVRPLEEWLSFLRDSFDRLCKIDSEVTDD